MKIDAHQHYWTMSRSDYGWITEELPVLYRDYLPQHLEGHLRKHHIDGTILVQAAPTIEETEYLLGLADQWESIFGVVGWLDLFHPEHREQFNRLRQHQKLVGFRIMLQDMPDASAVLEPAFIEALRGYAELDIPVDLLVTADQLGVLCELLDVVPGLRGVIDHIAKPPIGQQAFEPWRSDLERAAGHSNIYCKLSGMVTEADHDTWTPEQLRPYIEHVVRIFGPDRLMFGTDWPVCLLAAGYDEVVEVLEAALPAEWGEQERAKLYGENARTFYKLGE
ncbi:amidohydrolase family protein [Paenibacillus sp. PL2-23]|uniref:amidohydrolase family protein n=1 Tax=Paenibacillus sp. PL2-23 TaxID=2100729 RepID=UPI0030F9F57A